MKVLILGYGLAGAWIHDPLIRSTPGLEVSAVVTSDPDRGDLARSRHAGVEVYQTAHQAIVSSSADIAVVATPNEYHVELADQAMREGMAVVVDKPLANNAREAADLSRTADRLGATLAVFQNRRWDGDFLTLQSLVSQDSLGQVHLMSSRFDRWAPTSEEGWRDVPPDKGGGLLLDLGSHLVDQALLLFGPVETVYCETRILHRHRRSEDMVFISLEHTSGVISHLHASALEGSPGLRFHVSGSEGAYVKFGKDPQEEALGDDELPIPGKTGFAPEEDPGTLARGSERESVETMEGDWGAFYRQLLGHLEGSGPNPVPPEEACEVLRILDLARKSASNGNAIPAHVGSR